MATAQIDTLIRHLRRDVLRQDGAGWTDGQLLASFIDQKDEAAFEALVRRHGSMVFGVCRRVVGNHHDAEDAFQATFLVLARKASSVRPRERVANWLHGVALRTAMKANTMTTKRRGRERPVTEMPEPEAPPQGQWRDLQPLLDQQLNGLPEKYRLPILLCDLEGKAIKEAAQQLGWPQGTLAGRLARARKLLAKRLTQRGVVLSGGALAAMLGEKAVSACLPVPLAVSTTKAAVAVAAGQAAAPSLVSAKVAALMEGVMKSMMLTKLKTATMVLLALGMVAFGGSMVPRHTATAHQVSSQEGGAEKPPIRKADSSKSLDEEKLHGEWIANGNESGNFSLIFGPGKTVRRIAENDLLRNDDTGTYSVDWSKNPYHLDFKLNVKLPVGRTIMEFVEPGKLRIEMGGGDEARPKAFTDETIVLTRMEKHPPGSKQAIKDADREIKAAESYRRTGKFSTAYFYYQLVQIRYPGTNFAEKAKQGLEDLKKHRARLLDGSEVWGPPDQPLQPPPPPKSQEAPRQSPPPPLPPMAQEAPKASRDALELRQQVKALESRLAALEDKGKPQPAAKTDRNTPAYGQEVLELRQRVKNLESRLAAIEADSLRNGTAPVVPPPPPMPNTTVPKPADRANERPVKVGNIAIVGNTKTEDGAIRKKLGLNPGDTLDYQALRRAEKNLAALNATITVIASGEDSDYKDIRVTVVEK